MQRILCRNHFASSLLCIPLCYSYLAWLMKMVMFPVGSRILHIICIPSFPVLSQPPVSNEFLVKRFSSFEGSFELFCPFDLQWGDDQTRHANSLPCSSPSCGFAPGITSLCGLPVLSLPPAEWPQSTFMALSVCGCIMLASKHPALNQLRHLWEQLKSSNLQHCPVRQHWTRLAENAVDAVLKGHFLTDTTRAAAVALVRIIVVVLMCSVARRETPGDTKVLLKQDQPIVCL